MIAELTVSLLSSLPRTDAGQDQSLRNYPPDATAWAILALQASGRAATELYPARARLAADQLADGRVSLSADHPEAFWPTSLAVLAWHQDPGFSQAVHQAANFLLKTVSHCFTRDKASPYTHDPSIRGWPWVEGTFAWVIPSALAVLALKSTGYAAHARVMEATRLLLDRQLSRGGWNYGNTRMFGQDLHPMAETTGIALTALTDLVPRERIALSLEYLKKQVAISRTPISLSWGLLGLRSWGEEPSEGASWLETCWRQRERYGGYDATSISLMLLALAKETL